MLLELIRRPMVLAALAVLLQSSCRADTITLNDGTVVEGTVVDENDAGITVKIKFGQVSYKRAEIKSIVKGGGAPAAGGEDPRDVLVLKSGAEHRGLLVSENEAQVVFDLIVSGKAFSKALATRSAFARTEIRELRKITDAQRASARASLAKLESSAKQEAVSEQSLPVQAIEWPAKDPKKKIPARKIELEHFVIESNASEPFLRKSAYRLSRVFNAYQQHFGTDHEAAKVRVLLFSTMEDYYSAIGNEIKNPAFYSPAMKLICAGCDVAKYEFAIKEVRELHAKFEQQLLAYKKNIADVRANLNAQVSKYHEKINAGGKGATAEGQALMEEVKALQRQAQLHLGKLEKEASDVQNEIAVLNRRNDTVFNEYTQAMFATLYHEGFHAFLDNFLFPEGQSQHVPRWLNEGLAQYFECARIEGERFILGQEDREKMTLLKKWKKAEALVPLDKLVAGGPQDYLVHEISNIEHSTKHYLQAWCLVHWLGERGRLQKEVLRAYVGALNDHKKPLEALPLLSGASNEELTKAWEEKLQYSFGTEPGAK